MRRFLEECDSIHGFHLLLDADGGFGGAACALLTQIRDDYSRAPCLAVGLGSLSRPSAHGAAAAAEPAMATVGGDHGGLGAHSYAPALNDALSLNAFAELNTCYVPVYGSTGLRAVLDAAAGPAPISGAGSLGPSDNGRLFSGSPCALAPPLLAPRADLRYHTSAPIATLLDAVTMPYRARAPAGSLNGLVRSLVPRSGMHVAVGALGLPMPLEPTTLQRQGWFMPMAPLQRAPAICRAYEQHISWLGHPGGGRAIAPLVPTLLPCRSDGGAFWVRPQPFALPLSFPQFFCAAVGRHGEVYGAPTDTVGDGFSPALERAPPSSLRQPDDEVLHTPVAAALQSSPALSPMIRRVCADWAADRRAAERAASAEGWAQRDELAEVTENMDALREAYAEDDGGDGESTTVRARW